MADLDSDSIRITPGFLRYAMTNWHEGDAGPKQRPPYYHGVPANKIPRAHRTPTIGGRVQPSFHLTLLQEEVNGEEGEVGGVTTLLVDVLTTLSVLPYVSVRHCLFIYLVFYVL